MAFSKINIDKNDNYLPVRKIVIKILKEGGKYK